MEEWRDINEFEGHYQVSNLGRVKSLKWGRNKIMKLTKNNQGYCVVTFFKDETRTQHKVHRLVAEAFIPNPENKPHIDHINTIRCDNKVENLRWCTQKENNNNPITKRKCDSSKIGRKHSESSRKKMSETRKGKKPSENCIKVIKEKLSRRVFQYSSDYKLIKIWQSTRDCHINGFDCGNVSKCCNGKREEYKGYIWSYVPL